MFIYFALIWIDKKISDGLKGFKFINFKAFALQDLVIFSDLVLRWVRLFFKRVWRDFYDVTLHIDLELTSNQQSIFQ